MKYLIIGLILMLVVIAACAPIQEAEEQTTAEKTTVEKTQETKTITGTKTTTETIPTETKTETKTATTTKEYCGDGNCDRKETCDTCSKDCGKCALDFSGLECEVENDRYTVMANIRNLGTVHQKQTAYPKVIFADSGVFTGELKELSIDPYSSRNFVYFFTLTSLAESVKVYFVSDEEQIISKELTAECEIKE